MKENMIRKLCQDPAGEPVVLQGNIAFAVGCVRSGIHCADGYPGTPSSEVIDRGLSQVQDLIKVGWSVNEAVASAVGFGHTMAGEDCVVTMKIPGLFQAGDIFSSAALIQEKRGALIYYVASDFTPSSTQHVIDPRYFISSCQTPIFEPRNHQEMMEASSIAVEIGRRYHTPVVILAGGVLCHSEGMVHLNAPSRREAVEVPANLKKFNVLPVIARVNYDTTLNERLPALVEMVEASPLNEWIKGAGKTGVITYGPNVAYAKEVRQIFGADFDLLSLAFTNPLPLNLIQNFCDAIQGDIYIIEDGSRFVQAELERLGIKIIGKDRFSRQTEWSPALVAETLGYEVGRAKTSLPPVPRPPMICAGCPYRLFTSVVAGLKKRGKLSAVFGDIGCNSLLYFMDAMDTGLAMGASDAKRQGYVLSKPDMAARCISIIGDSTECHSGLDGTRNAVFRNVPGVKVILDNYWTAMTGGQPSPASPVNLAGQETRFDLAGSVRATGAEVIEVGAYDRKALMKTMKKALEMAGEGLFVTVIVKGSCIKKVPSTLKRPRVTIDRDKCDRCGTCLICPGIEKDEDGYPVFNNLCSGCAGENPACLQMCPFKAMSVTDEKEVRVESAVVLAEPPEIEPVHMDRSSFPERLALAIRGVGGQGTLFFGRVMTKLAFLAGYGEENILKGETHGMAQMGGPVISTFSCGNVFSSVLFPGSADSLIVMEVSEILRHGFLELIKPGGTIILANTRIVPQAFPAEGYPGPDAIAQAAQGFKVIEIDALGEAMKLGDATGRIANVVLIGALSKTPPFDRFPVELWLQAVKSVSPAPAVWSANYHAFQAGRARA